MVYLALSYDHRIVDGADAARFLVTMKDRLETGTFEQPYLLCGTKRVTGTSLSASTDAQLKQMMQAVVTSGTAAAIGFGSGIYAKTGTADIQGQEQPNSWLVAFDPAKDVAANLARVKKSAVWNPPPKPGSAPAPTPTPKAP